MGREGFWNNQEKAQATIARLKDVTAVVKPLGELLRAGDELQGLLEMAEEDAGIAEELRGELTRLETALDDLETRSLLSGEHDSNGAIVDINARDGGVDANDWAEMLLRMYIMWADKNGYSTEVLDRQDNDEAGITSASLAVRGPMAYGYLKGETGIHRLVRISPFNADGKRQTSFAAVDVSPEPTEKDEKEIEINDDDLRVDVYRASGAGGQHVNKTSSAVRMVHLPTNIVVTCQNERSQHKNRALAMKMLRARLVQREEEKREVEQLAKFHAQARVGFGAQIRSYFLHPDQRVKDERTEYKETNFHKVLDGGVQGFLDAYLRWRVGKEAPAAGAGAASGSSPHQ
jgi:peptide chain release factor 2